MKVISIGPNIDDTSPITPARRPKAPPHNFSTLGGISKRRAEPCSSAKQSTAMPTTNSSARSSMTARIATPIQVPISTPVKAGQ